jgi:flagellar hook-associated protein 1 FlgK
MPGLFQGLEIGKRALLGHQVSLQTIGHNIANVNTIGYTRQRVRISPSDPEVSINGPIGTGLRVDDVYHVRDLFLGQQYREASKDLGAWSYKQKTLHQIESIFAEPQDDSLNETLNQFFNDWSALATDAENSGHRSSIIANANQLINGFKQLATSLEELQRSTDRDLQGLTAEVNQKTSEIAQLNYRIVQQELDGSNANDLRDLRDLLVDELAQVVDINTNDKADGSTTVYMGAMLLVDGVDSFEIDVRADREDEKVTHTMVWKGSDYTLRNVNGQIAGLIETRDVMIPRYLDQLNELARTIVEEVNAVHMAGYGLEGTTNVAFFDPNFTEAKNIRLSSAILMDKNMIAASDSPDPAERSNGRNATAVANLRNSMIMSDETATFSQFYSGLVGNLGVEAREATSFTANYELITQQIDNQRQSVQGVSLDEEMAELVKAQHAFDAASRVVTVMDEALDTVISKMGIVG